MFLNISQNWQESTCVQFAYWTITSLITIRKYETNFNIEDDSNKIHEKYLKDISKNKKSSPLGLRDGDGSGYA